MPISLDKLSQNFRFEVASTPGGEYITKCFACGTCTLSCPVREIDERYNPRRIIHMVLLGMKEEVLKSDFIWLCTACYTCSERCPQGVGITDLMNALKNIAVKEGYVHPSYIEQMKALISNDALYEVGELENKKREKLGLPKIEKTRNVIKGILDKTGITKLLKS